MTTATPEEIEHDEFLLNLLREAPGLELTKLTLSKDKEPGPDIRFHLSNAEKTKHMNVGAALITTTGLFGFGKPVLYFFAFYHFKPSNSNWSSTREYLYGSEYYIWKKRKTYPYYKTWWNKFTRSINDWGKRTRYGAQFEPGSQPTELEEALISCVSVLIKFYCSKEAEKLLKMKV